MATKTPQEDFHKTGVRMPRELHAKLHESATRSGRSYNAEIIARLEGSFDQVKGLPFTVQEAIANEQEARGGTTEDALIRLAQLAMANGGTLLSVTMTPGTTVQQFGAMLEASRQVVPPDASFVVVRS